MRSKQNGFYPDELLEIIDKISNYRKRIVIKIGETYAVRAFFAISEPEGNEVEYQSGYLDLKLIMKEGDLLVGEVVTLLPPHFILKKGNRIKITKDNIIYKPNYKTKENGA
jgi:hypothetical protein